MLQKVFLSYHHSDSDEVAEFIDAFGCAFSSALSVGITTGDGVSLIGDEALLLAKVSDKYLRDSTTTIVLVGNTTWARRFVDWEIAATLGPADSPRTVVGVLLPSVDRDLRLPSRLMALGSEDYVRPYPKSVDELCQWIADARAAFGAAEQRFVSALMRCDQPLS